MAVHPILVAPDPRLKQISRPVDAVDASVRQLMDDLLETMYAAGNGIGLAAPQIGDLRRVIVLDVHGEEEPPNPLALANPEIVWASDDRVVREEGCLSLPEQFSDVSRPARVRIRFLDRDGKEQEIEAGGLLGVCLQHEIDHLDGRLFVDHLSTLRRGMVMRRLKKTQRRRTQQDQTA